VLDEDLRDLATDNKTMHRKAQEVRKITMKVMDCSVKSRVAGDGCIDKNSGEVWLRGTANPQLLGLPLFNSSLPENQHDETHLSRYSTHSGVVTISSPGRNSGRSCG
jgi:hypothetical protein